MILVIKTTVTVLDPRMGKHQCVTIRTKGIFFFFLRKCLCFRRYVCIKEIGKKKKKKLTVEPNPLSGTGPMSNYLKI